MRLLKSYKIGILIVLVLLLVACNEKTVINEIVPDINDNIHLEYRAIQPKETERVSLDRVVFHKRELVGTNEVVVYSYEEFKEENPVELYMGIEIDGELFEIGIIAYSHYIDYVSAEEVIVGDDVFICIKGVLGAAYPVEYYVKIMQGKPFNYVDGDLPIMILDVDGDGNIEWVSSYNGNVSIYKMKNEEWLYASINEVFDGYIGFENDLFILNKDNATRKYNLVKNGLIKINN